MPESITNISAPTKWMYTPREGEQFFFMHIPKTGGTTFRKMLTNHFPEGSYYPTQDDLIKNGGGYYTQRELVNKYSEHLKKPLIIGHYSIDLIKHLNPNVKVITFLRNPIDQILSHVKHILKHDSILKGADPNEIIEKRIKKIGNIQTRFLARQHLTSLMDKTNNLSQIYCLGIQENYNESIDKINQKLNWKLDKIKMTNTSNFSIKEKLTSKSMSLICRNVKKDIIIYDQACNFFESEEQRMPIV